MCVGKMRGLLLTFVHLYFYQIVLQERLYYTNVQEKHSEVSKQFFNSALFTQNIQIIPLCIINKIFEYWFLYVTKYDYDDISSSWIFDYLPTETRDWRCGFLQKLLSIRVWFWWSQDWVLAGAGEFTSSLQWSEFSSRYIKIRNVWNECIHE